MPKLPSAVSKFLAKFSSSSTSSTSAKMAKQTITVFGATGKQGSSVVKSILGDSKASSQFNVKAVTRDPTKDSAKALASLGADVVKVQLTRQAVKGPYSSSCRAISVTRPHCTLPSKDPGAFSPSPISGRSSAPKRRKPKARLLPTFAR